MDEFLTKEYSPSQWSVRYSPNEIIQVHGNVLQTKSDFAYKNIPNYSLKFSEENKEECLEIFYKNSDSFSENNGQLNFNGRKVFIYLHGGYWQWGTVFASSFMAVNFIEKDIILVACGYDLAPNVTMTQIIQQVEKGVAEILKNSSISEVYLCGHSAGAHLAACLLHSDFNQRLNVDINKIKGFFLVAGVYDLTPLLKTDVNDNVKMDLVEATKSSPMFINETCFSQNVSILVVYGENESNEFKKQSKDYSNHLTKLNFNNVCCEQIDAVDHFDLIENLSSDNFILTKKIYEVMNIN